MSREELIESAKRAISDYDIAKARGVSVASDRMAILLAEFVAVLGHIPTPSTDDELLDTYRDAVDLAMHRANMRDGFASNMSRESIVAGLRAVARFRRSVQGEPTDAQVEAALQALGHARSAVTAPVMRAALRAAAEAS